MSTSQTQATTSGGTPLSAKGQRTRQRIFDAAFSLFAENGFQAVSLRDIAARVGVTHVTVLHYFASKEVLLTDLMLHRDEEERRAAGEFLARDHAADPEFRGLHAPVLRWFLHRLTVNEAEQGAVPLFLKISTEAVDAGHPAHQHFVRRYELLLRLLTEAFAEEFALRGPGPDIAAQTAASHLIALSDGLPFQSIYSTEPRSTVAAVWEYLQLLGIVTA